MKRVYVYVLIKEWLLSLTLHEITLFGDLILFLHRLFLSGCTGMKHCFQAQSMVPVFTNKTQEELSSCCFLFICHNISDLSTILVILCTLYLYFLFARHLVLH